MKGYYICKKCGLCIKVNTFFYQDKNSKYRIDRAIIPKCPHCGNTILEVINYTKFSEYPFSIFLNVNRSYSFRKIGKKQINLSLKYE